MEPPTVDEVLAHCEVTSTQLDKPCSITDIVNIAGFLGSWRDVAPVLGLDENDVEDIERDVRTEAEKRPKALRKWKSKFGYKATYMWLVEALVKDKMVECAEKVCQLVNAHYHSSTSGARLPHRSGTSMSDRSGGGDQWATGGRESRLVATMPIRVEVGTLSNEESWDLSSEFAAMMTKLIPLMDKALKVEDLKLFLELFCDVRTGKPYIEPAFYQHCTSTAEILRALLKQFRFHSIQLSLLTKIVEKFGCDECKCLLQVYECKIPKAAPLKHSRNELTDEEVESSHGTLVLKVKITGNYDTCSLEDVERTREVMAKSSGVNGDAVVYARHEPGSVVLAFIIPASTVESFTSISKREKHLSELAAEGILSISIDEVFIDIGSHLVQQKAEQAPASEQEAA